MYLVLFGVGIGFVLISLILGGMVEVEGVSFFSFLKPTLIAVFLMVMGGIGLLFDSVFVTALGDGLVLFASFLGGLGAAGLVNRFVLIPLQRAQNTSAFFKQNTLGTSAEVIEPIPQGGYGKIRYNVSGSVVTSPAKSEDGNAISRGTNVEIFYIDKNTYVVRKAIPQT